MRNMKRQPDARMVDIQIVEVPHQWKGLVPDREIMSEDNTGVIRLIHQPSGIQHSVQVDTSGLDVMKAARLRAEAKLAFIKLLHGDS